MGNATEACLFNELKNSEDPKIKIDSKTFCFIFVMIEEERLADESPWQVFERLHRIELLQDPKYLQGQTLTFKKHYIGQLMKALHQIAKDDCSLSTVKR